MRYRATIVRTASLTANSSGSTRRRLRVLAAVATLLALAPASSSAQSLSEMVGKAVGADPQVVNAAKALEERLKAKLTDGEATRGASGAIGSLLVDSDNLICSAWIVSFRTRYRNMLLEGADPEVLSAMENLMEQVEKACDKVMNREAYGTGAATTTPAAAPVRNDCPECDPFRRAVEARRSEYERAQYELALSMRWTDFVERVWKSGQSPQEKAAAVGGQGPEGAERDEARKRAAADNAKAALDRAQKRLVECLERCHKEVRAEYGFLGGPLTKYVVGGAALLAGGLALAGGGGAGTSVEGSSSAPPGGGSSTAQPPASGLTACAGRYETSFNVSADPRGHRAPIGMPAGMTLEVAIASVHVRGPAPFVEVGGPIAADGTFTATGLGAVAGFANVRVEMSGRLTGCGSATGTLTGVYSMGTGGELPGGVGITYAVRGSK